MSQYIEFFARKDDTFVPIYSESRNGSLYPLMKHFVPYEKLHKLNRTDFLYFNQELDHELFLVDKSLTQYRETMELLPKFSDPIDKKIEILDELTVGMNETMESRAELLRTRERLKFLEAMVDEAAGVEHYEESNHKWGIYCGIEAGIDVTAADISE